jgi:hypothetical protein
MKWDMVLAEDVGDCPCSSKHIPKPATMAVVRVAGKRFTVCPTTLWNLIQLLWELDLTDGDPLGSITKHYGKFVRDLASEIYEGSEAGVS